MLHATVLGLAAGLRAMQRLDARFAGAVRSLTATYSFRSGGARRTLVFREGRIRTHGRRRGPRADYEIVFVDLRGALARLARNPDDVLRLQLENSIHTSGNIHYLFQLGFLFGLASRYAGDRARGVRSLAAAIGRRRPELDREELV